MITVNGYQGMHGNIKKFSELVGLRLGTVVKKLTVDIFKDIVEGTPIDTGRAMNNWVISVGMERHKIAPGVKGNMRGQKTLVGGGTKAELKRKKKKEAENAMKGYKPTQVIYITNSLDYIKYLNEGSSKQAPANFVQNAVFKNTAAIDKALQEAGEL